MLSSITICTPGVKLGIELDGNHLRVSLTLPQSLLDYRITPESQTIFAYRSPEYVQY